MSQFSELKDRFEKGNCRLEEISKCIMKDGLRSTVFGVDYALGQIEFLCLGTRIAVKTDVAEPEEGDEFLGAVKWLVFEDPDSKRPTQVNRTEFHNDPPGKWIRDEEGKEFIVRDDLQLSEYVKWNVVLCLEHFETGNGDESETVRPT